MKNISNKIDTYFHYHNMQWSENGYLYLANVVDLFTN